MIFLPTPTLGVMALYLDGRRLEELAYFRKLSIQGKRLGLQVIVFTPEDVEPGAKQILAWCYDEEAGKWTRKRVRFPDVIYDRCRYQKTYRFQLLRKFRRNYPNLLYMSRPLLHKWGIHQVLYKNKAIRDYLPETVPYQSHAGLLRMLDRYRLLYVKPVDGTGGRGILRMEKSENGLCRVQGRDRSRRIISPFAVPGPKLGTRLSKWNLTNRYLIQQGINVTLKDGRVHDFRLLIQKNGSGQWEVTGSAGRIGPKRSITSNLHGGGSAEPTPKLLRMRFATDAKVREIEADMERLAHLVVNHLEKQFGSLCEMALDIAVDETGHVWLLEINPKPSREVFSRIGETDTYRKAVQRPLEYALHLLRQKN